MLLGLHTYSLYLHGIGQAWADFKLPWPRQMSTFELLDQAVRWGLDGLHLDDGVLGNLEESYLKEVSAAAEEKGLYLEYNFSMDLGGQRIGIQHDPAEAIATAQALGADIVKVSMDLIRPRPVAASRFHPDVMTQIKSVASRLKQIAPAAEAAGVKIAVENHCDAFSEEILWLLDQVEGARVPTANGSTLSAAAAAPAKENRALDIVNKMANAEEKDGRVPELPENPSDEELRLFAENHPKVKKVMRLFRGKLVNVTRREE